jgi:hypothetical protein
MFNARTAIRTLRGVDMVCCYVDTVSRQEVELNGPPPSRVWSKGGGCRRAEALRLAFGAGEGLSGSHLGERVLVLEA